MRLSRRLIWTSAATLAVLTAGVTVGTPWAAKRAIAHVAQNRGWTVRTEGARIGLRGIWFDRIALDAQREATLHAEFGPACIGWSSVFGKRKFSVASGRIQLTGTFGDASALLRDKRDNGSVSGSARISTAEYDVHHLDLEWREQAGDEPKATVHELELSRLNDRLVARIGTLSARHGSASVELTGAVVEPADSRVIPDAEGDEAAPATSPLRVSVAEMLTKYDSAVTSALGGETPKPRDSNESEQTEANKKDVTTGVHANATVSSLAPKTTRPHPKKPHGTAAAKKEFLPLLGWLIDEVERLRTEVAGDASDENTLVAPRWLEQIAAGTSFESPAFRIRIVDGGQKLDLGPWPLRAERQEQELNVELSQNATAGKSAISAKLTVADRLEHAKLRFAVGPITLPQLGVSEGDLGLENIATTQLEIEARAEFQSKTGEVSVESKGRLERLSIRQPFLARETVKNIGFEWDGAASLDSAKRQLKSDMLRFSVGPVSARLRGTIELAERYQVIDAALEVPLAACQDLVNVLPDGLAPLLYGWRLDRNFALRLSIAFDSRKPDKSGIGFSLDNHCRVVSVPQQVAATRFEQPFVLDVEDEHGNLQPTSFGPGTWGWVPLGAISPYVESAVLVCEDGRFLYHNGFDREAIQNSIRENLRALRFARGASTVSMQLAKNLYLRRDKTIARKIQEAALTMLIEQSFSKRQLLELYLNVIEFGPGIYGIGPAAKQYFDTTPDRLTLAQSFYLISILPNPKQQHFGPDGPVRPGWMKLVRGLMTIAHRRGHFSAAELEAGLLEEPAYRVAGNSATAPSRRILQDPSASLDDELAIPPLPDE